MHLLLPLPFASAAFCSSSVSCFRVALVSLCFFNFFRSGCCLVASCAVSAAFAACVCYFFLKCLAHQQKGPLCPCAFEHKTLKVLRRKTKILTQGPKKL